MSPLQAAVLGMIQGITEFLPISSSAHLYVVPTLLRWPYAGVAFDVALHWGTLLALLMAFWGDWWSLGRAAMARDPAERSAAWQTWFKLGVASVPGAVAGLLLEGPAEDMLRSLPLQATMLFVFGFLLWAVDRMVAARREVAMPGWGTALLVGCAQALALVPGVSRSGITITVGRAMGLSRTSAARFSFLLATPITLGAGVLELRKLAHDGVTPLSLAIGIAVAAVTGFLAIRGLIRWLGRSGFGPFFAYRAAFAGLILLVATRH